MKISNMIRPFWFKNRYNEWGSSNQSLTLMLMKNKSFEIFIFGGYLTVILNFFLQFFEKL